MNRFQFLSSASVIAILLSQGAAPAFSAEQAGTATAAVPSIQALLEGRGTRSIAVGNPVFRNEQIETGPDGHLHVLLLDESNLTLGPNSRIVIDEFLYDPDAGTGKLAVDHAQGVMRFIGGQLSKDGGVTVRTSNATIGIRGGIAVMDSTPGGPTRVFFVYGDSLSGENAAGETFALENSGFALTIGADGSFGTPEPIDPAELSEALANLESPTGQTETVTVPDAAIGNLQDRLTPPAVDPETGLPDDFEADAPTLDELEELIGTDVLDEEDARESFDELEDEQDNEDEGYVGAG